MRGRDQSSGNLFSYVDLEERVPDDHPLRLIREIVNDVLGSLSSEFETLYSDMGRPSIPPEKLLRALLLQAFYSIRSERQLMEHLNFNMLFCWFVGLGLDDGVWDASAFCHNRDRLLEAEVSGQLLAGVIQHHKVGGLLSRDHFSVDGTLIEAWASMKSFRPKGEDDGDGGSGRNAERDFHGEKRSNATHASTTDPDAQLYRKGNGRESKLCYMGHALTENRHGLAVGGGVTIASGTAEREAALDLIDRHRPVESRGGRRRITVGGDKGFDVADFVEELRHRKVTPPYRRPGPRHQDRQAAQDQDRRAHDAPSRLRRQPTLPQAHRGGLRLAQDERGIEQDQIPGPPPGRRFVHPGLGRLQPRPTTQTAGGGANMTGDAGTPLTAKWQIIELDEAQGIGSVEIEDGFTLRHEISFHFGDESEFKARQ